MLFMVGSDYTVKIGMYWTQDRANAVQLIRYTGHLKTIEKNHVTRQEEWSRGRNILPEHPEKYPLHRDVYLADKKNVVVSVHRNVFFYSEDRHKRPVKRCSFAVYVSTTWHMGPLRYGLSLTRKLEMTQQAVWR
jgi:hypothetical protein